MLLVLLVILIATTLLYMRKSIFGKSPSGERLEQIKQSPNYTDGAFQNLSETPQLAEGYTMGGVLYDYLFTKKPRLKPKGNIPSVQTDIKAISPNEEVLLWFGHSSYYVQLEGLRILVDPVFSGNASPIPGTTKSFKGTELYTEADFPEIDYLFISHDHYDHLDYKTMKALQSKVKHVVCGLGVGAHLESWGYTKEQLLENDWHDRVSMGASVTAHVLPTRHFSGRTFSRNYTLWCSYLLETPTMKIYIGGDSGYDTHFKMIGDKFGPIDLAILENGQYNKAWRYIHLLPEELPVAAQDLQAKRLFPVHSGKFVLGNHPWDEPLKKISENIKATNIGLVTPKIGEVVRLNDTTQTFKAWWADVE